MFHALCNVAQLSQLTQNILHLFLGTAVQRRLEVIEENKTGLFGRIEFRNDLFERNLFIPGGHLQLNEQNFEEEE